MVTQKIVDEILEKFDMNNSDSHNEKLKISDFKNSIKVPYIGKPSIDYKKKV